MTLAPTILARGVAGKPNEINARCSVPRCISLAAHAHHIWPRSYLRGQPYDWVEVDGKVLSNRTGLCVRHHTDVTGDIGGHRARIIYKHGVFTWISLDSENRGPLYPQPKGGEQPPPPEDPAYEANHVESHADHGVLLPGQTCEHCGYTKPRPKTKLPSRRTSTWTVLVPADAELGTGVLDQWVEEFGVILGLEVTSTRLLRYHVLATVMAWAAQNQPQFIKDVREAGEA